MFSDLKIAIISPIICLMLIGLSACAHPPAKVAAVPVLSPATKSSPDATADIKPVPPPATDPAVVAGDASSTDGDVVADDTDTSDAVEGDDSDTSDHGTQRQLDEALDYCDQAQHFWEKGDLESALESLDEAYSRILTVKSDDSAKLVQQKEDLRYLISKRILEIYASRSSVVKGTHNAIPREVNANVQREINIFTKGPEKQFFIDAYKRSGKYRPLIVKKLKAAGLPTELSWLPLIESGFKIHALSRARALGLWQFIPSTGYKFGLTRNEYIDQRIDFEKSTDAAIAYLKELHNIFGDWSTVLAAYNCGEGRVLHVIRTQNVNYLDDFWDLYGRLPFETARYVPRFLAALHIIEHPKKYGLSDITVSPPLTFETVQVDRQVSLKDLAVPLGAKLSTLKELNPELRYSILPPDNYTLRVPVGTKDLLLATIDKVPVSSPPRPVFVYHRVRRGETLSTIARHFHTSVRKIMWVNNLRRSSYIVAGHRLKIPRRGMVIAHVRTSRTSKLRWNHRHVVRRGDSLWTIAKQYNTTTQKIQEVNHLRTTMLSIHQVLKVPSRAHASARHSGGASSTYYVQRGDSPYVIAQKYNITLNHFLEINNLTAQSTIYPGQSVKIE